MRPKSMVLIVIALGCGLIASIGISQVIATDKEAQKKEATEKIYVAVDNIDLGSLMVPNLVRLEEWPKDRVPESAVRNLEQIEGQRTLVRLFPGEPVLTAKLIDKDKYHDPTLQIPEGYRVVTIGVSAKVAVGHLIKPGDHVDIIVFFKAGKYSVKQTTARTVLSGIKVFAVNTQLSRNQEENDVIHAKNVSLLVKPNQVQKIMLAAEVGTIRLSLRRNDESGDEVIDDTTVADLFGDESNSNDSVGTDQTVEEVAGGITEFLEVMKASEPVDTDSNHGWEMTVMTANGQHVTYSWTDKSQLPTTMGAMAPFQPAGEQEDPLDPLAGLGDEASDDPSAEFDGDGEADWSESNPLDDVLN